MKLVGVCDPFFGDETLPTVQLGPPLVQLWTSPMYPVTGSQGAELNTSLFSSLLWESVESSKVIAKPLFLQTPSPQPFNTELIVRAPLDMLKHLHNLHKLCSWEQQTVLEVKPQQHWMQQHSLPFFLASDAVWCILGWGLPSGLPGLTADSDWASAHHVLYIPFPVHTGIALSQVQNLTFGLVNFML